MEAPSLQAQVVGLGRQLAALLVGLLVARLLAFLFRRKRQHETFKRMRVPGPPPHLLHGHLYDTRRQPYVKFAHKMHQRYGNTVGVYLGGDPYLLTKDLELIQQVFVARSRLFYDRMNFYLNVEPVPDNLICQRGDRWRYMRRLLTPAFSNAKIRSGQFYLDCQRTYEKFAGQLAAAEAEQQQQLQNGKQPGEQTDQLGTSARGGVCLVSDVYDRMAAIALDVIVKTAFHMDDVIKFDGPLLVREEAAAAAAAAAADEESPLRSYLKGKLNRAGAASGRYDGWRTTRGRGNRCPGVGSTGRGRARAGQRDAFLETAKRACRLGFNPLVELIFCFPFLDRPLTFLCNRLYFGSIIRLLFSRLDQLVVKRPAPVEGSGGSSSTAEPTAPSKRRRLIDSLVEVLRERRITKSEFTGNAFVILFAGFETTANALTFTLYLLAKHPGVQAKLRLELQRQMAAVREEARAAHAATGDSQQQQQQQLLVVVVERELHQLATGCHYLEMVINESLRLYPPVPGLACRQASAGCTLPSGLHIERGVNVVPSVYSIHRDPGLWGPQANEFQPERFELLEASQLNSARFMPFGLGPRNCIGKAAAMHELKIILGRLVLGYSIECITAADRRDLPAAAAATTPEKLRLCSPINITLTNADRIGLKFVKL